MTNLFKITKEMDDYEISHGLIDPNNELTTCMAASLSGSRKNIKKINLNPSKIQLIRAMCFHKVTEEVNDGSGDVICCICGSVWNPAANEAYRNAVQEIEDKLCKAWKEAVTDDDKIKAINEMAKYLLEQKY